MKKRILLIIFLFISANSFSQISFSGYTENFIGVNYKFLKRANIDFKVKTQLQGSDIESEFSFYYKINKRERINISLGVGVNFQPFLSYDLINGFLFPINFEYFPIKENKILSIIIEPAITYDGEIGTRNLFGIRLNF